MRGISGTHLEAVVQKLCPEVQSRIEARPVTRLVEACLWKEAFCCLLSSQVSYHLAKAATNKLINANVLKLLTTDQDSVLPHLTELLSTPIDDGNYLRRYRFPNQAAQRIETTFNCFRHTGRKLSQVVYVNRPAEETRRDLMECVSGFGPKQSSMFLRNVGVSSDLAILDRHVIRYMQVVELLEGQPPKTLHAANYWKLERRFRDYSNALGYSVGCVDWAIWVVMGAARQRLQ